MAVWDYVAANMKFTPHSRLTGLEKREAQLGLGGVGGGRILHGAGIDELESPIRHPVQLESIDTTDTCRLDQDCSFWGLWLAAFEKNGSQCRRRRHSA